MSLRKTFSRRERKIAKSMIYNEYDEYNLYEVWRSE